MKKRASGIGFVAATLMSAAPLAYSLPQTEPLPQPLTLEYALSMADEAHPALESAKAEAEVARADVLAADALTGVKVDVEARARWVEPADSAKNQTREDHKLSLFVRKNLYDFGRSEARQMAADAERRGRELIIEDLRRRRRLEIMERFFDVLVADLEFARDNENMATAYVALDKLRNRSELGQVSDIQLLEMESFYQQARRQRQASENRQRATRSRLAIALNRPGMLPSVLSPPELSQLGRPLPPYESLLKTALENHPRILALRARAEAASQRLAAARAGKNPYLNGEVEASQYARETSTSDTLRAGVTLHVPLYTGGAVDAAIARETAQVHKAHAELAALENQVRDSVLTLWLELSAYETRLAEAQARGDYRELYLDRSRAEYEMELKTDLGDAMVRLSEAQLATAITRYNAALDWERLDALTGGTLSAGTVVPPAAIQER